MQKVTALSVHPALTILLAGSAAAPAFAQSETAGVAPGRGRGEDGVAPSCKVPGLDEAVRCATYAVWEDRVGKK